MVNDETQMRLRFDYTNVLADNIGPEHGISISDVEELEPRIVKVARDLQARRKQGELPFMDLPYQEQVVKEVKALADDVSQRFDTLVLVGIGGSALGPMALYQAFGYEWPAMAPQKLKRPRIIFCDNSDPEELHSLMDTLDLERTAVNVITKSGSTAEPMSAFLIIREALIKAVGKSRYPQHIIATTDPCKGALRQIAQAEGYRTLDIHPGVGGRFSVFTPVGLFPAAVCGIDIDLLLEGAKLADNLCLTAGIYQNPAALPASLLYLADTKKNKPIVVFMPYSSRLHRTAEWFCQLLAESLGKRYSIAGEKVEVGQTPIAAQGATDQHSQLQLYQEGPNNKIILFIRIEKFSHVMPIPSSFPDQEGIGYLGGHTLEELILSEQKAAAWALAKDKRPSAAFILPQLNPFTLGQLLYILEQQISLMGGLYGINPYDQPGVEAAKKAAYAMLGRPGYEELKNEMEAALPRQKSAIL